MYMCCIDGLVVSIDAFQLIDTVLIPAQADHNTESEKFGVSFGTSCISRFLMLSKSGRKM